MLAYSVTHTEPWTYLNELRNPVQGFRVTFNILPVNEVHTAYVPTLDAPVVKAAIETQVKQREALMALGK